MPARAADQMPLRFRATDSPAGVSRETLRRLSEQLGIDETAVVHRALRELAMNVLPRYEADDGPLTARQVEQIRRAVPQEREGRMVSSLFASSARKSSKTST